MKKILLILLIMIINIHAKEIKEGDKAPDFILKTLKSQKRHALRQFKGKVILLNLWGSWCRGCEKEMPAFFKLQRAYSRKKFRIIGVSIDKKPRSAKRFLKQIERKTQIRVPFINFHDPRKKVAKSYGAAGMPSTYLIDKKGIVRLAIIGSLTDEEIGELQNEIDKLL